MINVVAIRPNGLTISKGGIDSWVDAIRFARGWAADVDVTSLGLTDGCPVFFGYTGNVDPKNLVQHTMGEVKQMERDLPKAPTGESYDRLVGLLRSVDEEQRSGILDHLYGTADAMPDADPDSPQLANLGEIYRALADLVYDLTDR